MRRHLNTLYVTTEGAYVAKDGLNVVVRLESREIGRVPVHMIGAVVCIGRVSMSPPAMGFCAENGATVSWLGSNGRFLARVEGPTGGNVLLRRRQYKTSDDDTACAVIVHGIVAGKVLNQRAVLRRALRDHGGTMEADACGRLKAAESRLTDIARRTARPAEVETLRGLEGEAASVCFSVFDDLQRSDESEMRFRTRTRRPPLDPVNALLSFVYTLLVHDIRSALETVGLDPAVGFLHRIGRASRSISWRSSGPTSPTGWSCPWSTAARSRRRISSGWRTEPCLWAMNCARMSWSPIRSASTTS